MKDLFDTDYSGAIFSPCRQYRYCLWRKWNEELPKIAFIGLNPSTANETNPDRTITRVQNFAKDLGYGGFFMLNLFAIVSSKPEILLTHPDPVGDNDRHLQLYQLIGMDVVFCWGGFKEARKRSEPVIKMFPDAMCLMKNKDGSPIHPLYVPAATKPIPFK